MPKSRNSRSKSPQIPLAAVDKSGRDHIFQNVQEIFKDRVDADVIYLVLTECNWIGDDAVDKLLHIAENADIQHQYKQKSKLQQIAEGVFGPLGSNDESHNASLPSSPLSQADKVIQRPVKATSTDRSTENDTTPPVLNLFNSNQIQVPIGGLSARGSGSFPDASKLDSFSDDIESDLHFPRLPTRKSALSRSSASSPISSGRTYSGHVHTGSQPDLMSEAQTAYQQQYDDAAGAQRWEDCKNLLSERYLQSISDVRRSNEDLLGKRSEKTPQIAKSRSAEDNYDYSSMSQGFQDDRVIKNTEADRPKTKGSRSFPVRLLSKSPDDEEEDNEVSEAARTDSADLDETVLKCIYEVHDELVDHSVFAENLERQRSSSAVLSDFDSDKLSGGTPEGSGHVTPIPNKQPMTLPVIGLSVDAAEFVPRPKESLADKPIKHKTDISVKETVKPGRSKSIEIKSGAKNMRITSPTVQLTPVSPPSIEGGDTGVGYTVSPMHSPVISPPSPNVGSPASNLSGSPMFITPKWQPLYPRMPNTPPPPLRPPVSVITASGTRYMGPPPPHHLPPPQYRLSGPQLPPGRLPGGALPFSSRMVYPVAASQPIFRVAGVSPHMQTISHHQIPTSMEERALIATGQPIMATAEQGRVMPKAAGVPMKLVNKQSIDRHVQKIRELQHNGKKVIVIMRGLPGSGKTTLARALRMDGVVLSTDDYFMKGDMYSYNPDKLAESHQWNRERAKEAMKLGTTPIVIDNTNTQKWEFKPYVSMAYNNGYHVEIIEPDTPWKNSPKELARLTLHGVPKDQIQRMLQRYEKNITVEMLITKKKGNITRRDSPVNANSSFEDDTSSAGKIHKTELGQNVKTQTRSSSLDKELESMNKLSGDRRDEKPRSVTPQNGERVPLGHKRLGLQSLNLKAKSLGKSEKAFSKKAVSKETKKKSVNKPDLNISEDTVKVVDEIVSEHVIDKSLSRDDLARLENELKALLQIHPMNDTERAAAETLISQKLHGSAAAGDGEENGADIQSELERNLELNVKQVSTVSGKKDNSSSVNILLEPSLTIDTDNINYNPIYPPFYQQEVFEDRYMASFVQEIDATDISPTPHSIDSHDIKIDDSGIINVISSISTSDTSTMISETQSKSETSVNNRDVELQYWNKEADRATAASVEYVPTTWDEEVPDEQLDWSGTPCSTLLGNVEQGVRPQRQKKVRHNSSNSSKQQHGAIREDAINNEASVNTKRNLVNNEKGKSTKKEKQSDSISKKSNKAKDNSVDKSPISEKSRNDAETSSNTVGNLKKVKNGVKKKENGQKKSDNVNSRGSSSKNLINKSQKMKNENAYDSKSQSSKAMSTVSVAEKVISTILVSEKSVSSESTSETAIFHVSASEKDDKGNPIDEKDFCLSYLDESSGVHVCDNDSLTLLKNSYTDIDVSSSTLSDHLTQDGNTSGGTEGQINSSKSYDINTTQTVDTEIMPSSPISEPTTEQTGEAIEHTNEATKQTSKPIEQTSEATKQKSKSIEQTSEATKQKSKSIEQTSEATKQKSKSIEQTSEALKQTSEATKQTSEATKQTKQTSEATKQTSEETTEKTTSEQESESNIEHLGVNKNDRKAEGDIEDLSQGSPRRKRQSRKKLAAKFKGPFFNESDKQNFSSSNWASYPVTSEHLNSSTDKSEIIRHSHKDTLEVNDQETVTLDDDFRVLSALNLGGFVDSSVVYITSKNRTLANTTFDEPVRADSEERGISERHSLHQSTSTDDLITEDSDSLTFLKTCFPNTKAQDLECVLEDCDGNVEWAIDLMVDWKYHPNLSEEEQKNFVESLDKYTKALKQSSTQDEVGKSRQPDNLRDLCFNLIEERKIASKEELEQQLIQTGKERLNRIEGENLTKIRLRRTSSMSDTSPRGRRSDLNLSGVSVYRSISTPGEAMSKLSENVEDDSVLVTPELYLIKKRMLQERNDSIEPRSSVLTNDIDTSESDRRNFNKKLDLNRRSLHEPQELECDTQGENHTGADGALPVMTMQMGADIIIQLESLFGPIGMHNKESRSVNVDLDNRTAWSLYQCLKHSLADTRQVLRRQLAQDEELARRLQEEEDNRGQGSGSVGSALGTRQVKPLVEIMAEEAQIQSKQQQFEKILINEGTPNALATRMKRNKLYTRYPNLDRTMLDEVFQNQCFNLTDTVRMVEAHLGVGNVHQGLGLDLSKMDDNLLEDIKLQSVHDQMDSFLYTPHVSKDYQDGAEPEYEDYRGEAHMHHRLRHECFQKAQEAFRRGLKQVASFYSQQGHLHSNKIKEANMRASELILEDRNLDLEKNLTLDLHGLHVDEAIAAMDRILPLKQREQKKGHLTIITGRGSHSRGGVAKLRPSVLAYLRRNQYNFTEVQTGFIKVSLKMYR